jgi:hypothetical protein
MARYTRTELPGENGEDDDRRRREELKSSGTPGQHELLALCAGAV